MVSELSRYLSQAKASNTPLGILINSEIDLLVLSKILDSTTIKYRVKRLLQRSDSRLDMIYALVPLWDSSWSPDNKELRLDPEAYKLVMFEMGQRAYQYFDIEGILPPLPDKESFFHSLWYKVICSFTDPFTYRCLKDTKDFILKNRSWTLRYFLGNSLVEFQTEHLLFRNCLHLDFANDLQYRLTFEISKCPLVDLSTEYERLVFPLNPLGPFFRDSDPVDFC